MSRALHLLFFLVIFAGPASLQGQTGPANADYLFEVLELPDGPAGNSVNCVVQGPAGFMWFGAHAGLYRYDGYHIKSYKNVPGDSTSLVYPYIEWLFWDKQDFLWVGTYGGGLFRFDPRDETFHRYQHDPDDPSSLSGDYVTYVAEDSVGALWVGTTNGLNRMDRATGRFERFLHDPDDPQSLSLNDVRCLYVDRQGTVWVGTGFLFNTNDRMFAGLNRFDPQSGTFTKYFHDPTDASSLLGNYIRSIYEDSKGNFWVGGLGGLQLMDREKGTFQRMLDQPGIEGEIFAPGTRDGEFSSAFALVEDAQEKLWVFTLHAEDLLGSISVVDLNSMQMETLQEKGPNVAWQVEHSRDGSIWLAGAGIAAQALRIHRPVSPLSEIPFSQSEAGYTESLLFDGLAQGDTINSPNDVWLKTYSPFDGSLRLLSWTFPVVGGWDMNSFPELRLMSLDSLSESRRMEIEKWSGIGLAKDREGYLWGANGLRGGGLFRFDPKKTEVKQYRHDPNNPNSPLEDEIHFVIGDQEGNIWMAYAKGISRLDPVSDTFTHFGPDPNDSGGMHDSHNVISALFVDQEGYIWIGRGEAGTAVPSTLEKLDPKSGKVESMQIPGETYRGRPVISITQNNEGAVIGLHDGKGLSSFNPVSRTSDPLFPNRFFHTYNLIADEQGMLWLTDAHKVIRIDSEKGAVSEFFLPQDIFREQRAFKDYKGRIFFSTYKGLVVIDPREQAQSQNALGGSPVKFTELIVNGEPVTSGRDLLQGPLWQQPGLSLRHTQGTFSLRFSLFDFKRPENARYEARLKPQESEWRRLEGDPILNFYQLAPGDYTLEVRGYDSNSAGGEVITALDLEIAPPWWRSVWAYLVYVLLLAAAIWAFIRWRLYYVRLELEKETARASEAAAREANEAKSTFLSTVSHELRTPLTSIIGFTKLNKKNLSEKVLPVIPPDNPKAQKAAQRISKNLDVVSSEGERLTSLINELLDLAKIESGKVEWKMVELQPAALIERAVNATAALFEQKPSLKLVTEVPDDLPAITGDRDRLLQVLINLISNAVKFTDSGQVTLAVNISRLKPTPLPRGARKAEEMRVGPFEGAGAGATGDVLFSVSDTGSGIPADQLDKVFERFQQVEDNQSGKPKGTGLGLPICKEIVEHHGGKIWVESALAEGSTFFVSLPFNSEQT